MEKKSDEQLIKLIRRKTRKSELAFAGLLDRYNERLYWHVRKILITHEDTNDVVQNTWVKVYQNLHAFRHDSKFYTWLYRIATNEALSFLQKQKRTEADNFDEHLFNLSQSLESDEWFDGDEIQTKLQKAILKLPEKQRLVFNMKYFDEMKYQDIADILETSVGALKASYHHAVKKIEETIKAEIIEH